MGAGKRYSMILNFFTNIVYVAASVVMVRVMSDPLWSLDLMNIF